MFNLYEKKINQISCEQAWVCSQKEKKKERIKLAQII